jgi:plasmid maintenance system antidote protein VapI
MANKSKPIPSELLELLKSKPNLTNMQIAEKFNIPRSRVERIKQANNLTKKKIPDPLDIVEFMKNNKDINLTKVSEIFRLPVHKLQHLKQKYNLTKKRVLLTPQEIANIVEYVKNTPNTPQQEVADIFDISIAQLSFIKQKHKLTNTPVIPLDTPETIEFIKNNPSLSKKEMAQSLGITINQLSNIKDKHNLTTKGLRRFLKKNTGDGMLICSRCGESKDILSCYHVGTINYCKDCRAIRNREMKEANRAKNYSSVEMLLRFRMNNAKTNLKYRKIPHEFTIDLPYLLTIYENQKGKCYYSGLDMTLNSNDGNSISLDRIDSTKGYIMENVVLCRWTINNMKNDMTVGEFYQNCKYVFDNMSIKNQNG